MVFCNRVGMPHSQFLSWEPSDRAKAIAHDLEESARCSMCGTSEWEWEADRFAYEAVEHTCRGCQETERASKEMDSDRPGVTVRLASTHGPEAEKRRREFEAIMARSRD